MPTPKPVPPRHTFFERLAVRVRCCKKPSGDPGPELFGAEGVLVDVQQKRATVRFDDHGLVNLPLHGLERAAAAPDESPSRAGSAPPASF